MRNMLWRACCENALVQSFDDAFIQLQNSACCISLFQKLSARDLLDLDWARLPAEVSSVSTADVAAVSFLAQHTYKHKGLAHQMDIKLFNTLTRKREVFKPLKDKEVKMFVCGSTVYDYLHLGHARTYSFYDSLVRFLKHLGYHVTYIQNVTDVGHLLDTGEDRMIKKAREEKKEKCIVV